MRRVAAASRALAAASCALAAASRALAVACTGGARPPSPAPTPDPGGAPEPVALVARLPLTSGPMWPALTEIEDGGAIAGAALGDTDGCEGCHADVAAQWRTSAHSFASFNNPVYRVVVERFRERVGFVASRFCGGCHDPALLVDGAMDAPIAPADRRAHAGITCRTCHGVVATRPDGNGSYTLTAEPIPIPRADDPESVRRHVARAAKPALRTADLCVTCHRSFLGEATGNPYHLVGQDDATPWQRSAYAGSRRDRIDDVAEADCRGCHMPLEPAPLGDAAATDGQVRSHRFLGGHTWLAAMRADADGLARAQAFLRGAASIDVVEITPGRLDVVVVNRRVGHRFPGGVMDAQDTWIEVVVMDARGRVVAEAGTAHAETGADPTAHGLRSLVVGEDGRPRLERETHEFRATAWNHTIPPRDVAVVGYAFEVPADVPADARPLRVSARLRHRSRNLPLAAAACAETRTPRGRRFQAAAADRAGRSPDPCVPQPITDIAEVEVALDGAPVREWRRLYDHGRGLLHGLQERLDDARPSLEGALALAEAAGDVDAQVAVMAALGQLAGHQGRTDEALAWLDRADALRPEDPALAHARGAALAYVWRWSLAAPPLEAAARTAPRDDRSWAHAAIAFGAAGDHEAALRVTHVGLASQPRDADLLRIQALALETLGADPALVERAREAWLAFRAPDRAPAVRGACSARVPGCALERVPVHVHVMRSHGRP